jgi:hypothetical protein
MQKIKERHIIVDLAFTVGGAVFASGVGILLTTPEQGKGITTLATGLVVLLVATLIDRRNINEEEHEVEEAEHIIQADKINKPGPGQQKKEREVIHVPMVVVEKEYHDYPYES